MGQQLVGRVAIILMVCLFAVASAYADSRVTSGWMDQTTVALSVQAVNDPGHPGTNTQWTLTISGTPYAQNSGQVTFTVTRILDSNGNTVNESIGSIPSFNATVLANGGQDTQFTYEPTGCLPRPGTYRISWTWRTKIYTPPGYVEHSASTTYATASNYKISFTQSLQSIAGDVTDATSLTITVKTVNDAGQQTPANGATVTLSTTSPDLTLPTSGTTNADGIVTMAGIKSNKLIKTTDVTAPITISVQGTTAQTSASVTLIHLQLSLSITYPNQDKQKLYVYAGSAYLTATAKAVLSAGTRPVAGPAVLITTQGLDGTGTGGATAGQIANVGNEYTSIITGAGPTGTCVVVAKHKDDYSIIAQQNVPVRYPDKWDKTVSATGAQAGSTTTPKFSGKVYADIGNNTFEGIPQIPVSITVQGPPPPADALSVAADSEGGFERSGNTPRNSFDGVTGSNSDGSVTITAGPRTYDCFLHYMTTNSPHVTFTQPNFSIGLTLDQQGKVRGTGSFRTFSFAGLDVTPTLGYDGNLSVSAAIGLTPHTKNSKCGQPTFSPAPGTYTEPQTVTISTTIPGATIRYTTDGTTPTSTNGTVYVVAINIATTTTIKARVFKDDMNESDVATGAYTIN